MRSPSTTMRVSCDEDEVAVVKRIGWPFRTNAIVWPSKSQRIGPNDFSDCTPKTMS
jgi:hypothetical protein